MPIRRLRLSCSSDEDEEPHNNQRQPQPNPPPNPNPSHLVEISDDEDFIDVSDNLSPEAATSDNRPPQVSPPVIDDEELLQESLESSGDCPISDVLLGLGLKLKRVWLDSCVQALQQSVPGYAGLDAAGKAKLCFEQFLVSDMNHSGGGVLPGNVDRLHLVDLPGPYVLQVDEIVNISCPLKGRYQKAPPGIKRCLKLSMTDGVQRVYGMEYRPINHLDTLAPAGLKVAICKVHVRHGLLMLVPEAFEVLGGVVEELEAARQRLVEEVNKPPRGKRTRMGVVPPLRTRVTLAAWSTESAPVPGNTNGTANQSSTPFQTHGQGATFSTFGTGSGQRIAVAEELPVREENAIPNSFPNVASGMEEFPVRVTEENAIPNPFPNVASGMEDFPVRVTEENAIPNPFPNVASGMEEFPVRVTEENATPNPFPNVASGMEEFPVRVTEENAIPNPSSSIFSGAEEVHMDTNQSSRASAMHHPSSSVSSIVEEIDIDTISSSRPNPVSDSSLNNVSNDEEMIVSASDSSLNDVSNDVEMIVVDEVEHPQILSRNQEDPFTYLASLSAKWAAMKESVTLVKGTIKCFLTGVKGFQWRQRTTYDLRVYVDDGSLIAEIQIDHNVVQKVIGHSPEEVTSALTSSDVKKISDMKEILTQFQHFLANFEGTMLVEINETSPLPVALEINQGCLESDAWLLFRRVKSSASAQRRLSSDPLDLSP
ncbi:hypothetical protein UlMin_007632 [Ulmus minor]